MADMSTGMKEGLPSAHHSLGRKQPAQILLSCAKGHSAWLDNQCGLMWTEAPGH